MRQKLSISLLCRISKNFIRRTFLDPLPLIHYQYPVGNISGKMQMKTGMILRCGQIIQDTELMRAPHFIGFRITFRLSNSVFRRLAYSSAIPL
jgi:hypothetical protein